MLNNILMDYRLEDVIDSALLQGLQEKLNLIISFPTAILDNDGKILTAVAWQDLCTKFHRINPQSEKECFKSDRYILEHLHEANPAVSYQCPHGLIDTAVPIIIDGNHLGNFFTGQFFLEKPDLIFFRERAKIYGFAEKEYLEALEKVPIWTKEKLTLYLDFIKGFIEIIVDLGLKNLKEIESNRNIKEAEDRNREIIENSLAGYFFIDREGIFQHVNPAWLRMHKYDHADEVIGKHFGITQVDRDLENAQKIVERIFMGDQMPAGEFSRLCKDGSTGYHTFSCIKVIKDEKVVGLEGFLIDLTERKMDEKLLSIENRISKIFLTANDDEMFNEVLKVVLEALESPFGVFGYIDIDGAIVIPTITKQIWDKCKITDKTIRFQREAWGDSTWAQALREKRTIYSNEPSINVPEGHANIKRHISRPILFHGESIGLFQVANRESDYTDVDLKILERISDHVAPVLYSMLKLRNADKAAKESEDKFRTLFEKASDGIFLMNLNLEVKYINESFAGMHGYSVQEMFNMNLRTLDTPETFQQAPERMKRILNGETLNFEVDHYDKQGKIVIHDVIATMTEIEGEKYILAFHRDITERKQSEAELKNKTDELKSLNKELGIFSNSNRELEQFAYVASHNLQEPLRTVSNYAKLLEEDYSKKIDDKALRYLHAINDATKRMTILLHSLLEFSRLGRNLVLTRVDCKQLINDVLADLENTIATSKAIIEVEDMPVLNLYDSEMRQLFQNLISNAIKFVQRDTRPKIGILSEKINDNWKFSVRDNGIGIAPEYFERIFEIFKRLHNESDYKGSGIGLAYCKRIVELHKGEVWVESTLGQGTTFHFTIPVLEV
jgi:PAS domain S-box-containing protein